MHYYQQYNNSQNLQMSRETKRSRKTHQGALELRSTIQTRASTTAELIQQKNKSSYKIDRLESDLSTQYSRTNQRNVANQASYPQVMRVPPAQTYMPQQLPQGVMNTASMTEQPVLSRYNTRSAVHNVQVAPAPSMNCYWNKQGPPVTPAQYNQGSAQQMNMPAPVESPIPKQTKETQTEFTVSEIEVDLLLSLRSKRLQVSKLCAIINKKASCNDFIEKEPEKKDATGNKEIPEQTFMEIVEQSNTTKDQIFRMFYEMRQKLVLKESCSIPFQPMLQGHNQEPPAQMQSQGPQHNETSAMVHQGFPIPTIENSNNWFPINYGFCGVPPFPLMQFARNYFNTPISNNIHPGNNFVQNGYPGLYRRSNCSIGLSPACHDSGGAL